MRQWNILVAQTSQDPSLWLATIPKQGTWTTFMCIVHENDANAYSDAAVRVSVISRKNFNKGFDMEFGNNNMTCMTIQNPFH